MADDNPVVRMSAADAFGAIYGDEPAQARISLLGDVLQSESDKNVRDVYLSQLGSEAHEFPELVDDVLRNLFDKSESSGESDICGKAGRRLVVEILTILMIEHQTHFATETLMSWAANAPQSGEEVLKATHFVRDYLVPTSDPAIQERAFDMVATAAESCTRLWNSTRQAQTADKQPSESELPELKHALSVLDSIANQLYFASGAFDEKKGEQHVTVSHAALERFANLATPVLITCARSQAASIVHHVVETLIFLAPLNEKRALVSTAEAVATDGTYAYDRMSSNAIIPYLRRLLAENRQLVLFDDVGVVAFRKLLSALASAGNEAALELAFTFSDVFR